MGHFDRHERFQLLSVKEIMAIRPKKDVHKYFIQFCKDNELDDNDVNYGIEALIKLGEFFHAGVVEELCNFIEYKLTALRAKAKKEEREKQRWQAIIAEYPFANIPDPASFGADDIYIGDLYCWTGSGFGRSQFRVTIPAESPFQGGMIWLAKPGMGKSCSFAQTYVQMVPILRSRYGKCTSLVFECAKISASKLLYPSLKRAGIESQVVTSLPINLLQIPAGVPPEWHAASTVEAFAYVWRPLSENAKAILQEGILLTYDEWRINTQREYFPDIPALYSTIEKMQGCDSTSRSSVLGKLRRLISSAKNQSCISKGYSFEDFEGESVIFSFPLAGIIDAGHQALTILHFAQGGYNRKIALDDKHPTIVAIEEAGAVITTNGKKSSTDPLPRLTQLGREPRVGFMALHQHASDVDSRFISSTEVQFVGRMGRDQRKALRDMGCPSARLQWACGHMGKYEFVFSTSALRDPLLIHSAEYKIEDCPPIQDIPNQVLKDIKIVTSEEVRRLPPLQAGGDEVTPIVARETTSAATLPGVSHSAPVAATPLDDPQARRLFLNCVLKPDAALKTHYNELKMRPSVGSKILAKLAAAGYVARHVVVIGQKRHYKIVQILKSALQFLTPEQRMHLQGIIAVAERAGPVHGHKARRLARFLIARALHAGRNGVTVRLEEKIMIGNALCAIDVAVLENDQYVEYYEIEETTDGTNSLKKLAALNPKIMKFLVVCDEKAANKVREKVKDIPGSEQCRICTLSDRGLEELPLFDAEGNLVG